MKLRSVHITLMLALLLTSCHKPETAVEVSGQEKFREGDLVFRCGRGAESRFVTTVSKSIYSHIGILHRDSLRNVWQVIHAVPGEAGKGEPDRVKCESIADFFHPDRAKRGAWARVNCPDSIATAATRYAWQKALQGVEFDHDYSLADTDKLYCTELIYQSYRHQGIDVTSGMRHPSLPLFSKDSVTIFPGDIIRSGRLLFISPFNSNQSDD